MLRKLFGRDQPPLRGFVHLGRHRYPITPCSSMVFSEGRLCIELGFSPDSDHYGWMFESDVQTWAIRFEISGSMRCDAKLSFLKHFADARSDDDVAVWFDGFHYDQFDPYSYEGYIRADGDAVEIQGMYTSTDPLSHTRRHTPIGATFTFDPSGLAWDEYLFLSLEETRGVPSDLVAKILLRDCTHFPGQLLAFKNLQELHIHTQAPTFTALPPSIGELSSLRDLLVSAEALETLPDTLGNLSLLETLAIIQTHITHIPNTLCTLKSLMWLSLESNRLETLPECIGQLTETRLCIEANPFVSLPASLCHLKEVQIEQEKKVLYMDTTYRSANPDPIDHTPYYLRCDRELLAALAARIDQEKNLHPYKETLMRLAYKTLYFETTQKEDYAQKGNTRFGGMPDLPPGVAHPINEEGEYYSFHAQINLAEIAHLQDYLPREGLLYFFVSDEEYVEHALVFLATDAPHTLVRHVYDEETVFYDGPGVFTTGYKAIVTAGWSLPTDNAALNGSDAEIIEQLHELVYTRYIEQGKDNPIEKLLYPFCPTLSCDQVHTINGYVYTQHESPQEQAMYIHNGQIDEYVNLLTLRFDKHTGFCFWDAGDLTYTIHKKDLAIADFSKVVATIESS